MAQRWGRGSRERRAQRRVEQAFGPPAFRLFTASQPCAVCRARPSENAHVKSRGAGGGWQRNIVPLCLRHHAEEHASGRFTFQQRYGIDLQAAAECHYERWLRYARNEEVK